MQPEIDFTSPSPVNTMRLSGQNLRLYQYLASGKSIHCFHPAKYQLQIGYLNSRIADLIKRNVPISKRNITVKDINGDNVSVVEYSIDKL